ncbi:hypothetical protein GCM10010151_43280 [Actinoallomurus spadix]|uniref:Uncharacterized protein n=1 Tax=Actinoallomurus spadix TaxID=79912 RepID=A0ABN0WXU7_9ACTN
MKRPGFDPDGKRCRRGAQRRGSTARLAAPAERRFPAFPTWHARARATAPPCRSAGTAGRCRSAGSSGGAITGDAAARSDRLTRRSPKDTRSGIWYAEAPFGDDSPYLSIAASGDYVQVK